MLTTSLDLLYLTLAACAALLTGFICWALYYFVRMEKDTVYTMEKLTSILHKADDVLSMAQEKIQGSGAYVVATAKAVKSVMDYMGERKATKRSKK